MGIIDEYASDAIESCETLDVKNNSSLFQYGTLLNESQRVSLVEAIEAQIKGTVRNLSGIHEYVHDFPWGHVMIYKHLSSSFSTITLDDKREEVNLADLGIKASYQNAFDYIYMEYGAGYNLEERTCSGVFSVSFLGLYEDVSGRGVSLQRQEGLDGRDLTLADKITFDDLLRFAVRDL